MAVPKSITKVTKSKDGAQVSYKSSVDAVQYTLQELTRGALRDVGRFIVKEYKIQVYRVLKKRTGNIAKNIGSWTRKNQCDLVVGMNKVGKHVDGFYGSFYEVGAGNNPKLGILRSAVLNNIDNIIDIEKQYLSGLNDEHPDLSGLSEDDYLDEG